MSTWQWCVLSFALGLGDVLLGVVVGHALRDRRDDQ